MLITNPSHSAYGSASGIAKLYGILANGGVYKGKRLFNAERTVKTLSQFVISGVDQILKVKVNFGHGVTLSPTPIVSIYFTINHIDLKFY